MNIEDLLAIGMVPHVRVRYGPGVDDAVSLDAGALDLRKKEVEALCRSIPNTDQGLSWRLVMPYTSNNGVMAKVLIALGELLGVWKMHPRLEHHALWNRMHPMIQAGSVVQKAQEAPRMPKPSRGDLEAGTKPCHCCRRPMGPQDSMTHELFEVRDGYCLDCDYAGCEDFDEGECNVFGVAKISERRREAAEEGEAPDGLEAYVRQFE